jgi:hypothetical protein
LAFLFFEIRRPHNIAPERDQRLALLYDFVVVLQLKPSVVVLDTGGNQAVHDDY